MPVLSTRVTRKVLDQLEQIANKNDETVSETLRKLVKNGVAVENYKTQQIGEATERGIPEGKQKIEMEYKRSFEMMMLEAAALLRLTIRDSGKFTPEEATKLLNKARQNVETYFKHYDEKLTAHP
jgi:hypothetical protein